MDGVDSDVEATPFDGRGLGHAPDGELRRRIADQAVLGLLAVDGADVHDGAATGHLHGLQHRFHPQKGPHLVDVDDLHVVVQGGVLNGRGPQDGRVVDQNIQRSHAGGRLYGRVPVGFLGHIQMYILGAFANAGCYLLAVVVKHVPEHYLGPL